MKSLRQDASRSQIYPNRERAGCTLYRMCELCPFFRRLGIEQDRRWPRQVRTHTWKDMQFSIVVVPHPYQKVATLYMMIIWHLVNKSVQNEI